MQPLFTKNNSLGKKERLNNSGEIVRIRREGRALKAFPLKIMALENKIGIPRLVLVLTKHTGNSVQRNRVKRWVREFFRTHKKKLGCLDYLVFGMGNLKKINRPGFDKITERWLNWV